MRGDRVRVDSSGALPLDAVREHGRARRARRQRARERATRIPCRVLVWNYHDDDLPAAPAEIDR